MSERINIRLPDDLVKDCKVWAKSQGITLTDMIISGLQGQLQTCQPIPRSEIVAVASHSETVYVPDTLIKVNKPVSKPVSPVVIPTITQAKAAAKPWFRPCSKADQTRNAGKSKARS